jgi:hypothetical protein
MHHQKLLLEMLEIVSGVSFQANMTTNQLALKDEPELCFGKATNPVRGTFFDEK